MTKQVYFEMVTDDDIVFYNGYENVYFFDSNEPSIMEILEQGQSLLKDFKAIELTTEEMLFNYLKNLHPYLSNEDNLKRFLKAYLKAEGYEKEDLEREISDLYDFESQEFVDVLEEYGFTREGLAATNGLSYGLVGFSDWNPFITFDNMPISYVNDLWEGTNFYGLIAYNSEGNEMDSLQNNYITSDEDLKTAIESNFVTDDETEVYLVDNMESAYFDAFPKVEKIIHETYSFKAS